MCFKRKVKEIIIGKYSLYESVRFHYKGELRNGSIYNIKKSENGNILYDITLGGECPVVIESIRENDILK